MDNIDPIKTEKETRAEKEVSKTHKRSEINGIATSLAYCVVSMSFFDQPLSYYTYVLCSILETSCQLLSNRVIHDAVENEISRKDDKINNIRRT